MSSLILGFVALSVFAVLFLFVPLFSFKTVGQKNQFTASWYKQRLAELETELSKGQFTPEQYKLAVTELQLTAQQELKHEFDHNSTALEKASEVNVTSSVGSSTRNGYRDYHWQQKAVISVIFLIAVIGFYQVQGNYSKLNQWQEAVDALPALTKKIIQNENAAATPKELRDFALGLRTKLAVKDEAIGWMLLGRTLLALNDIDSAIGAFQKSYEREPTSVTNVVNYAQALYLKGEEFELSKSVNLLRGALTQQPNNLMALILFGESSLLLDRLDNAKQAFTLALTLVEKGDYRAEAIQKRIDLIAQTTGEQTVGLDLNITLDPTISELRKFKYLFIFAKSASSPVPVAVKKLAITSFPLNTRLSDADTMLPDVKLSTQDSVNITARLSKDEVAGLATGEWQGTLLDVDPNSQTSLAIVINEETK